MNFSDFPDVEHKIESSHVQLRRLDSINPLLTDQIIEVFDYAIRMTEGLQGSLRLAITQLMTNAFDHSSSERGCYVCAQTYEKIIRLCVADFGVGLLAKLASKYNLEDSFRYQTCGTGRNHYPIRTGWGVGALAHTTVHKG